MTSKTPSFQKKTQDTYSNLVTNTDNYSTLENSLIIISKKEEYENDKFRIRKKFNFVNNINTLSQPNIICNEPSLQNSPKNNKYRSTQESNKNLLFQRVTKKLDTKIDGKQSSESFLFIPPEASMCCLPISQRSADSKDTDLKTEKESRECVLKNIEKKSNNVFSFHKTLSSQHHDDTSNDLQSELLDLNVIEELEQGKSDDERKKTNSFNDKLCTNNATMNNILFNKYNSDLLRKNQLNPLLRQNCSANLSSRLINDENSHNVIKIPPTNAQRFLFINEIQEQNIKTNKEIEKNRKIYIQLILMNNESFYHLLYFLYDDYDKLMSLNKQFRNKIQESLAKKHEKLILNFKKKYSSIFTLTNIKYQTKSFIQKNNTDIIPLFEVILTNKILPQKKDYLSYKIGYTFNTTNDSNNYYISFQFDIRPRNHHLFWLSSEIEEYNYAYNRFCYTQNISSFSVGDFIQFKIGLFSPAGKVDTSNLKWKNAEEYEDIPLSLFEKFQKKSDVVFDKYRNCEIENIVHIWKNAEQIYLNPVQNKKTNIAQLRHKELLHKFKEIFAKNFEIKEIYYDVSKFFYFKIKMKANKVGNINKNLFINTGIEIVNRNKEIINESQNLYVLNHNTKRGNYQIREGTELIFYITDV